MPFNLTYGQFDLQDIYFNVNVYIWAKYIARCWAVKCWIEAAHGFGEADLVWARWDSGECHPVRRIFYALRSDRKADP